jgi:hypothetical protein
MQIEAAIFIDSDTISLADKFECAINAIAADLA